MLTLKPKETKPTLEMIRLPIFRVYYKALQDFVEKVYGSEEFDFLAAAGVSEGMIPEYQVTGKIPPQLDWTRRADAIRQGKAIRRYPELVLNMLVADKLIPAGRYIIDTHKRPDPIEIYKYLLERLRDPSHQDCVAFKVKHASDTVFQGRAKLVDQVWIGRNAC